MATLAASADPVEAAKRAAAFQAVRDHLVSSHRYVGIGSGSTVVYVVEAIKEMDPASTSKMVFVPTGSQSEALIVAAGLPLGSIDRLPHTAVLDVCFDGADEVDANLNCIKGGGACLWLEKLVATSAKKFVCVADYRKMSNRLGDQWKKGIPIEVLPQSANKVLSALVDMGSVNPKIRSGLPGKAGALVTDNGMWIIDAPFPPLLLPQDLREDQEERNGHWEVDKLADKLTKMVGVCEIGIFSGKNGLEVESDAQKPVAAYFGMSNGEVEIRRA